MAGGRATCGLPPYSTFTLALPAASSASQMYSDQGYFYNQMASVRLLAAINPTRYCTFNESSRSKSSTLVGFAALDHINGSIALNECS